MKAFLSHSSANKDYVEMVAKELGRQFCIFDKFAFQSGIEFKQSIEKGLDDSNIFVLFASQESLASIWVGFEVNEAFYGLLQKRINRVLVLFLGDSIQLDKLPEWLRRSKAIVVKSPKQAAREIRLHLNEFLRIQRHPLFIGRSEEMAEAESGLLSLTNSKPPHFLTFVGLPQIGRRSVARRVAQNVLGMSSTTEVVVESGDDLRDLTFKLAIEIEPYGGPQSLADIQQQIAKLSDSEAAIRAHNCLRALTEQGALPIFVDAGGLMDENGHFADCFHPLFSALEGANDVYLFCITTRKPISTAPLTTTVIRIPPLGDKEIRKLLQGLATRETINLSLPEIGKLADHVGGYPPSCYFAAQLVKSYGAPAILGNTVELIDFRVSTFVSYITKHGLSDKENELLRLLANFSPLPLPVVGGVCGLDSESASKAIYRLIDFSMILPDRAGCYQISEPLKDAVFKRSAYFTKSETQKVAELLNEWLTENPDEIISLSFSRVVYRVASQAGNSALASRVTYLTADTYRLADLAYNQQDYQAAVDGFRKVLELRPGYDRATVQLVRALAQLEEWSECDILCSTLEKQKLPVRTTAFLRGFIDRKRNQIPNAITQFELSRKAGRSDVAVLRELAWCHFISGDSDKAEIMLNEAFDIQPDNRFLIDMAVQVALKQGKYDVAKKQLERLRIFETDAFYWHRMATFYARTGDVASAVAAGLNSITSVQRPRFEALAHLAYCEIRLGKIDPAREHLAELDKYFPKLRKSVVFALHCHIELKAGNAEEVLRRIDQKVSGGNRFLLSLRHGAIRRLLNNPGLNEAKRAELQKEIAAADTTGTDEPKFEDLPRQ